MIVGGVFFERQSGSFGFRMDLPRAADGSRRQSKRRGFSSAEEALRERERLRLAKDAGTHHRARLAGSVRSLCEAWIESRVQELEANTVSNYRWLLGLVYPYIGDIRASALTGRVAGRMYGQLEAAAYSRTTLRTLDLVLTKAFGEETGRRLSVRKPRPSDVAHPIWTLGEAKRSWLPRQGSAVICCGGCWR
jgi:hypothetical protein